MRLPGLVLVLAAATGAAACGGRAADPGPAWPKSAGWPAAASWEADGGEPLDPRRPHVAAVEASADAAPAAGAPAAGDDVEVDIEIPATTSEPPDGDDLWFDFSPDDAILIEGELPPDE